ncbi:MAG: hypothetical protein IT176_09680 [Acidobacteria bacterium]|nr:hypothetical protein [Acidobacteriota bacterium]
MAELMAPPPAARLADGVYEVEHDGRTRLVYVAGDGDDLWAFAEGEVYRPAPPARRHDRPASSGSRRTSDRSPRGGAQSLTAPMPATVVRVLVEPGGAVRKGDTVVLLEAMKMELPLRAPADAIVVAVHCHEGELVQPDIALVELA